MPEFLDVVQSQIKFSQKFEWHFSQNRFKKNLEYEILVILQLSNFCVSYRTFSVGKTKLGMICVCAQTIKGPRAHLHRSILAIVAVDGHQHFEKRVYKDQSISLSNLKDAIHFFLLSGVL